MPYITTERRMTIDNIVCLARTPGELNYLITRLCTEYIAGNGESYQTYNDVIGALECAKQEYYRRMVIPYEEKKKQINGDVF